MNKYRNKKTKIDGIKFDSLKEARRYTVLKALQKAGKISDLRLQVPYELIPTVRYKGKTYRKAVYYADFVYIIGNEEIVEDVKGYETDVFKLKLKMLLNRYPEINFKLT